MFSIVNAISQFGEVISRKSLLANPLQITFLTMIIPLASVTSIWTGRLLSGRDQRKTIFFTGMITVLTFLSGFWLTNFYHLFCIFAVFAFVSPYHTLAQSRILQQYVAQTHTGRVFGRAYSISMLIGAIFSAFSGWWLDQGTQNWQSLFLTVGIVAFFGIIALSSVKTKPDPQKIYYISKKTFFDPWREVLQLLRKRHDFFRFEAAFMLYGIAFMMQLPIIPLYLVDDLHLHYADIGLARGTVFQLVMIVGIPFFGHVFDRSTPRRLSARVFALGALFPIALIFTGFLTGMYQKIGLFISFGLFGFIMSGVHTLWHLSAMRFARSNEDVGVYQSVHIAATGIRGSFAPFLGLAITLLFGNRIALMVAAIVWIFASMAMIYISKLDTETSTLRRVDVSTE